MTPIEKNVRVVDEQGNEYEATYPKRAKGLVKNGRARFVGENKICLACPPFENVEDNKMTDTEIKVDETTGEVKEVPSKYTLDYAFEQLERIREESSKFAVETREKISEIKSGGPGDIGAQAAGEALLALVQEQEQIYHRMIDFYLKIISDWDNVFGFPDSAFDAIVTFECDEHFIDRIDAISLFFVVARDNFVIIEVVNHNAGVVHIRLSFEPLIHSKLKID